MRPYGAVNDMDALEFLDLEAGALRLVLAPRLGGSIVRFDFETPEGPIPILRSFEGVPQSVLETANFPLVPYCNRIRDGVFHFRGREVRLAPNMAGDPSPLHGQGWLGPWQVERATGNEAELLFQFETGEWPWRYESRQLFTLDRGGLSLTISCRNLSDEPMPCGLGQHPYFPCTSETRLDTGVACVWTVDEKVLPVGRIAAEGRYALSDRLICGQDLDNGFGGWSRMARLATPGLPFRTEMSSPTADFFQIYSPVSGGFIAAEPVSHANAALNEPEEKWAELGLRVLEPGETMALQMRIAAATP